MTRLSLKATAIAAGLLWGGAILLVGLMNLADPRYGMNFIQMTSSVYPWFHPVRNIANVIIGTVDGLIDGAIAGLIFALLYNAIEKVPMPAGHAHSHQQT
jgi:predicted DNA repair protein MutK